MNDNCRLYFPFFLSTHPCFDLSLVDLFFFFFEGVQPCLLTTLHCFFKGVNTFLFYIILFTWAMYYSLTHWMTLCFRNWKWLMWKIKQLNSFVVSLGPFFFVISNAFLNVDVILIHHKTAFALDTHFLSYFHPSLLFIACVWWKSQKEDASMHFKLLIIKQ